MKNLNKALIGTLILGAGAVALARNRKSVVKTGKKLVHSKRSKRS